MIPKPDEERGSRPRRVEQLVFLCVMGLVFAWAVWEARTFPDRARIFPQVAAGGAVLLTLFALARELRSGDDWEGYDGVPFVRHARKGARYLLWIVGYYVALWLVGFVPATALFVVAFLRVEDGMGWLRAVAGAGALLAVLIGLRWALDLALPGGLVLDVLILLGG